MKEREYYLDIARVASMIAVIVIHVGAISWYDPPYSLYPWAVYNLFDCIFRYCVPVFLMISGYLFLNPDRKLETRKLYTKYIPRIVVAFFFWSFLYALITSGFVTQRTFSKEIVSKFFTDLFHGHYHMWYLFLVFGLYIMTPFLRGLVKDEKATRYYLIASFLIGYVLPGLQRLSYVYLTKRATDRMEFSMLGGFTFYYVFGYYIGSRELTAKEKKIWPFIGLFGFLLTVATTTGYVIGNQYPEVEMHEYYMAHVLLYSCACFIYFKEKFKNVDPNSKWMKVVLWLSKLSFGVYLAHDFGLIVFKKIGLTPASFTPFLSIPLLTILDLAITVGIAWVFSKIPILKKWVI